MISLILLILFKHLNEKIVKLNQFTPPRVKDLPDRKSCRECQVRITNEY